MTHQQQTNNTNGTSPTKKPMTTTTTTTPSKSKQRTSLTQADVFVASSPRAAANMSAISMASEDLTMEDVARIMREEDAHLLESMHFEQSCSTGETPVLTSQPAPYASLDDIPTLQFEAPVGEPLSKAVVASKLAAAGAEGNAADGDHVVGLFNHQHGGLASSSFSLDQPVEFQRQLSSQSDSTHDKISQSSDRKKNKRGLVYRQCLSGEIKSFPKEPEVAITTVSSHSNKTGTSSTETGEQFTSEQPTTPRKKEQEEEEDFDDEAAPEGEETTTSSVSDAACLSSNAPSHTDLSMIPSVGVGVEHRHRPTLNSADDQKRRRSSDDRRMNEAVQFAQAVGEMPPMDSNELCIIEEDDNDDSDDDDDDDDGNGTVIRLDEISMHDHLSLVGMGDNTSILSASDQQPLVTTPNNDKDQQPPIPREIIKRKSRPRWPLQLPGWTFSHLEDSSYHHHNESVVQDYVYKGIHSNPPEIVKRGMSRGNHVQLHRKAWLEVSDKYHRYGKNLRLYYRYWESLGYPTNMFFDWLDSKGEAAGRPLPNLDECPRSKLDSDTVLYIANPDVTKGYSLSIVTVEGRCRFIDVDGELVHTGPDGWIFVLRDGVIYAAEKITSINGLSKQRFHHSSFFGGKAVAAAGIFITDDQGFLTRLYPHSGHYRPREAHMQRLLYFLYHEGVDLRTFEMDTQQIMHVARDTVDNNAADITEKVNDKEKEKEKPADDTNKNKEMGKSSHDKKEGGEKKKKIDSLQLMPAVSVACYVAHKAHFIGEGIFAQIHQIRNANVASVTEALEYVNGKRKKEELEDHTHPEGTIAEEA